MQFDYEKSFSTDKEKWKEFDKYLSSLSVMYPTEFKKEIYLNKKFMLIGYKLNPLDITCVFNEEVPQIIQNLIINKLKQLFP